MFRGTFIEFRNGMINISPVGRNASCVCSSTVDVVELMLQQAGARRVRGV